MPDPTGPRPLAVLTDEAVALAFDRVDRYVVLCARHLWEATRTPGDPRWEDLSETVRDARVERMREVLAR